MALSNAELTGEQRRRPGPELGAWRATAAHQCGKLAPAPALECRGQSQRN